MDELITVPASTDHLDLKMDAILERFKNIEGKIQKTLSFIRENHAGLALEERITTDRACRDALMHLNHLAWSYALMQECKGPEYIGLHCNQVIWNIQFCLEQYFVVL